MPEQIEKILENLRRIPKRVLQEEKSLETKEKEYFAFRLLKWKEDAKVQKAEQKYNED